VRSSAKGRLRSDEHRSDEGNKAVGLFTRSLSVTIHFARIVGVHDYPINVGQRAIHDHKLSRRNIARDSEAGRIQIKRELHLFHAIDCDYVGSDKGRNSKGGVATLPEHRENGFGTPLNRQIKRQCIGRR
jgi:hypothetical protein